MKRLRDCITAWLEDKSTENTSRYVNKHKHHSGAVTTVPRVITVTYAQVLAARLQIKRAQERDLPISMAIHAIANAALVYDKKGNSTWQVIV